MSEPKKLVVIVEDGTPATPVVIVNDGTPATPVILKGGESVDYLAMLSNNTLEEYESNEMLTVKGNLFQGASSLKRLVIPNATLISSNAISGTSLEYIDIRSVKEIQSRGLYNNKYLSSVILLDIEKIAINVFTGNTEFNELIIGNKVEMARLDSPNAFSQTAIANGNGYIYVPSVRIEDYYDNGNWATVNGYASDGTLRAIEDYPEILEKAIEWGYEPY